MSQGFASGTGSSLPSTQLAYVPCTSCSSSTRSGGVKTKERAGNWGHM